VDDDLGLLLRWRGGDAAAGNELVRRHFSAVYRFFWNKVPDGVADLTQQTFLALVEGHERLETRAGFRAYLLGVARYKLVHHLRGRYRKDAVFSPARVSVLDVQRDPGSSPTRRLAQDEQRQLVDRALRSLPLDQQITLELHYWHELSVDEIAAVLERSPGTIKSRLHRARLQLKAQVERLSRDPAPLLARLEDELGSLREVTPAEGERLGWPPK
jgi:RNA polymerase sigma factor (sigma-70 family)